MASVPGVQFSITGTTGSQAALSAKSGYFAYVFPRGAWASQDSTGTLITFDSADIASRFAADDWIQVGLATGNLRKVNAVGGNSLSVQGAAVTVTEDNRVFLIGSTQPSTSGGSATYTIPATIIRHRDDDTSDRYTNSMLTSDSDGLIRFYATQGIYDTLIQDGNQGNQGYIADLPVGTVEGVSTVLWAVFGATVTINAALGVTGTITANTVTVNRALGVTGWATFGQTVTMNANAGVTGTFTVGSTLTAHAAFGTTGWATFGSTVTMSSALGVTGTVMLGANGIIGGLSVTSGVFGVSAQPRVLLVNSSNQTVSSGTSRRLTWDTEHVDIGGLHSGSSSAINITSPGLSLLIGQVEWSGPVGTTGTNTPYITTIMKNLNGQYEVAEVHSIMGVTGIGLKQLVSGIDTAAAGDYYDLLATHSSGTTQTVTCTASHVNTQFAAVKLF